MLVDPLSDDTLRLTFDSEIVLDTQSINASAYSITVVGLGDAISVREVLVSHSTKMATNIILVVDKYTHGTQYRVTATNLHGRDGALISGASDFIGRRTKTEDMLRTIPSHYNMAADSILRSIIAAIGLSDDAVGGSRNDIL